MTRHVQSTAVESHACAHHVRDSAQGNQHTAPRNLQVMRGQRRAVHAHTMATPATTTSTEAMTERVNTLPSQKCSTAHTKGMISSFAICGHSSQESSPTVQLPLNPLAQSACQLLAP